MITFKRAVVIIMIITVLGGGSLGIGISIGYAIGRQYVVSIPPEIQNIIEISQQAEQPAAHAFSFADQHIEALPVEVRVSDITEVVRNVSRSVVSINIEVPTDNRLFGRMYNPASGSGIIFAEDENFLYIATNNHVVYTASYIGVSFDDEYEVEARFIAGDWYADLAVISIPRSEIRDKDFDIAVFGDSSLMQVGDEVVAIGNPMGGGQTATRGIVSAVDRQITVDGRTLDVLQTDAAINPGNSGGALASINSEVIGINTAKAVSFHIEGMGYAIPSNQALSILERLLEEGTTPRPFLGVTTIQISEDTRRMHSLPSVGLMVRHVQQGSPAYIGGIQEFDLIVAYDYIPVEVIEDLLFGLNLSGVGGTAVLQVYRNGPDGMELVTVTVVIGDANER